MFTKRLFFIPENKNNTKMFQSSTVGKLYSPTHPLNVYTSELNKLRVWVELKHKNNKQKQSKSNNRKRTSNEFEYKEEKILHQEITLKAHII